MTQTSQEDPQILTQPPIKNPKKVEAGRKGALVKKLKKEQREKEREFKKQKITINII